MKFILADYERIKSVCAPRNLLIRHCIEERNTGDTVFVPIFVLFLLSVVSIPGFRRKACGLCRTKRGRGGKRRGKYIAIGNRNPCTFANVDSRLRFVFFGEIEIDELV